VPAVFRTMTMPTMALTILPSRLRLMAGAVIHALVVVLILLAPRLAVAACAPVAAAEPRVWHAVVEDPTVRITFLGHASFLIETPDNVRAITDYSGAYTTDPPPDIVTMNHAHPSHYTLHPDPRIGIVLHGWQEGPQPPAYDVVLRDLRVTNLATNIRDWDGGTELNGNSIFIFETAGLCIAHLGHLQHLLEPADLDALGHIDIVMIAVDGGYTIGQADARAVVEQIHPRIVLPMHYFTADNLARFLDMMRETYAIDVRHDPTIEVSRVALPDRPTVIALPGGL
jgi:L-ascorbate metabolism protein UlaG (beta-lactamase superfamily)